MFRSCLRIGTELLSHETGLCHRCYFPSVFLSLTIPHAVQMTITQFPKAVQLMAERGLSALCPCTTMKAISNRKSLGLKDVP